MKKITRIIIVSFVTMLTFIIACKKEEAIPKSSAKTISAFAFNSLNPAVNATISGNNVSATVIFGTDITKLSPTITLSEKATVVPASGSPQDFSKAVTYTVTAEDGSTQAYSVSVSVGAAPKSVAKDILKFSFTTLNPAVDATIDATAKTIKATLLGGTDATKLVPTISISAKASVAPASGVAQDFTKAVTYTVTAEDGSTQAYSVNVTVPPPTVSSFSPTAGKVGTQVIITGTNFALNSSDNIVKFNDVVAKVLASNATSITVEVPAKAGAGTISVESGGQKGTSGTLFTFSYSATTTMVGSGFKNPQNIAIDNAGNIYFAERATQLIKLIRTNGSVEVIAGTTSNAVAKYNVTGTLAHFVLPTGVDVDAKGENLYVTDESGSSILKINLGTRFVQQIASSPGRGSSNTDFNIATPTNLRLDEAKGVLYVNSLVHTIVQMKIDGTGIKLLAGKENQKGFNTGEVEGADARLNIPAGGVLNKDGSLYYFTDEYNGAVRVLNTSTNKVKTLAGNGTLGLNTFVNERLAPQDIRFKNPTGIALDSEGRIYVSEWANNSLRVYDPKSDRWQTLLSNMKNPYSIVINSKDELFISEWTGTNDAIVKVVIK